MKIMVCGDLHGIWRYFNQKVVKIKPDLIFVCGDFGYWPHYHNSREFDGTGKPWNQYGIINQSKVYFCDGNHENHDELNKLKNDDFQPVLVPGFENVYYMRRGSILDINGTNIMFFGGAESIDKDMRIFGNSWWPQESISKKDIENLYEDDKVDIMITHTLPFQFSKHLGINIYNGNSERWLDLVYDIYKPKKWYFGHFHMYKKFKVDNCEFTCLNMCNETNWYEIINL